MESQGRSTNWSKARIAMSRQLHEDYVEEQRRLGLPEDSTIPPELWQKSSETSGEKNSSIKGEE